MKDTRRLLLPALVDRLVDLSPESQVEAPQRYGSAEMRAAVRRDIENLLNSRQRLIAWPEGASEAERSVLAYGVRDLASANLASPGQRELFLRSIEEVLRRFEPRLKRVKVVAVDGAETLDRTLRFKIEALVHAEPAPELVTFDSTLEPVTHAVHVRA